MKSIKSQTQEAPKTPDRTKKQTKTKQSNSHKKQPQSHRKAKVLKTTAGALGAPLPEDIFKGQG
jgi:hypothetical protein